MPVESPISHQENFKIKTAYEKKQEEIKKRESLSEKWDRILAKEGMPSELSKSDLEVYIDDVDNPNRAVKNYVNDRAKEARSAYITGEHARFAQMLKDRFGISISDAEQMIENAYHF